MKISREVKTAILVISGIVLFVYLFNYLKGENLLDDSRIYYAVYDNVEGLAPSTPVTISGFNVGKVMDITFKGDGSAQLLVKIMIENDYEFSKNSKAELKDLGLIGGKGIEIIPVFDGAPTAESGDYLTATTKAGLTELVNKRLTPLQEKIEVVMTDADSLLTNVNEIFDEDTKTNLRTSIADLAATIAAFKTTSATLNKFMDGNQEKLASTISNFENTSDNFSKFSDSLADLRLAQTVKELQGTVASFDQLIANIENGEGTIGKLLKDEGLYDNLEGAAKQMEDLLQDLKLNPKRYVHFSVFGKKPKRYDADGNEIEEED
ncbi:MlaD family protein [Sediminibacter sp. Hel_I_10]|uniref:MlaD family protein n=1 Tax=Sediminibacter sp. Hel_I_10 TaxID=1392490 RepID=UPI00047B24FE|nr:MlaD family protein [Sediminibacter sp. Hel_I_10]